MPCARVRVSVRCRLLFETSFVRPLFLFPFVRAPVSSFYSSRRRPGYMEACVLSDASYSAQRLWREWRRLVVFLG